MKFQSLFISALVASVGTIASATTISEWNFNTVGVQAAPYNTVAATTGSGTALSVGMTNSFNGGNTASCDILSTSGTANPALTENTFRIRGAQTPTGHNGWATHAAGAAQYSQGIEFDTSSAGYSAVSFAFDWYSTTQGIRDLQFQYSTNGTTWINYGGTSPTGTYIATSNDWYNAPGSPTITVALPAAAANQAILDIRLVAAFDSTGNLGNEFASAQLGTGGVTKIYNNNSGNWRFGLSTLSGTQVPAPASLALLGLGAIASGRRRRA
jgi:hypothetical protein